jgi:hypothetical protein
MALKQYWVPIVVGSVSLAFLSTSVWRYQVRLSSVSSGKKQVSEMRGVDPFVLLTKLDASLGACGTLRHIAWQYTPAEGTFLTVEIFIEKPALRRCGKTLRDWLAELKNLFQKNLAPQRIDILSAPTYAQDEDGFFLIWRLVWGQHA